MLIMWYHLGWRMLQLYYPRLSLWHFRGKVARPEGKEYMHDFLEVYPNDWTMYNLLMDHVLMLRLMFQRYWQFHISLNLKKRIFCTPFRVLLGHIVCCDGVLVDPIKIVVTPNLPVPTNFYILQSTLGDMGYYCGLIKDYICHYYGSYGAVTKEDKRVHLDNRVLSIF